MSATEIILNICHRLVERRTAGAVPIYHLLSVVMILFFYVFNRFFLIMRTSYYFGGHGRICTYVLDGFTGMQ